MTITAGGSRGTALGAPERDAADYLPALTGLRGVAACWVLLFHLWGFCGTPVLALRIAHHSLDFTPIARCGFLGVDLFFVLSGFLLSIPFHRATLNKTRTPSLSTFWKRRCRRVLPVYWLQLLILICVYFLLGLSRMTTIPEFIAHVLLVQNLLPWPVHLLNPVYWSMPVEWDFYLVLPAMMFVLARTLTWLALCCATALALAFRLACYRAGYDPALAHYLDPANILQLPARLDEFLFGILGARLYLSTAASTRAARTAMIIGAVGVAIGAGAIVHFGEQLAAPEPWLLIHFTWVGAAFALLVWGAASQNAERAPWFGGRLLAWLGAVSYSLYLWHFPVLQALWSIGWSDGTWVTRAVVLSLAIPVVLFIAWLSYRYIERPFLRGGHFPARALP